MRSIGHLETEAAARTFGNFLYVQGVENLVEADPGHGWAIWVHEESELDRAAGLLTEFRAAPADPRFRAAPADPRFRAAAAEVKARRTTAAQEQKAYARRVRTRGQLFRGWHAAGFGPVSVALIAASIAVFFFSRGGENLAPVIKLFFSEYLRGMPEIRSGELWRLFTPILVHFGIMHIFFNLLWLRDLGGVIEGSEGSLKFSLLVLVIAGVSNAAQFFVGGPSFGGMSGVIFGLFGYIWMQAKFAPASGYFIHPNIVTLQLAWLVVCYTGWVGPVANTCHTVGLATGCAWGWLASLRRN